MRLPTFFATLGLALVMTLALPAQTVRVIFVSGQAALQRPDEPALRPVVKGETVIIGTRIVTGADGRVVLTPMPGVKSIVAPNTTLLLESVSEIRTSDTNVTHQAVLDLKEGAVVSDLQKPEGVSYDYSIRTARGLAGARGTTFTVGINKAGIQTIVVAHGSISINFTDGGKAVLTPGQLSITKPNGDTQSVSNVGELSEADQKIAKNWTETTVSAIATALETGIELDPTALNNALDAAKSLGITLSPETQAAVDRILTTTSSLFEKEETADPNTTVDPPAPDTEVIVTETAQPTALELFRGKLTTAQQAVFDALPDDIKNQLVTLGDLLLTGIALAPDQETGVALTHQDLRIHLTAFLQLSTTSPEALAFIKTLAGNSTDNFENIPDPVEWSTAAFVRTLTNWNALSDTEKHLIIAMGAGEAIMDKSAGYISALLGALDANQLSLMTQAGWGHYLDELAGKPTNTAIFTAVSELSSAELAVVKSFRISPDSFRNFSTRSFVSALASLSAAEQTTLRQLGIGDIALDSLDYSTTSVNRDTISTFINTDTANIDYAARFAATLTFYNTLSIDEQTAVRALELGHLLYDYSPTQALSDESTTALQRVRALAQFYITHPDLQQSLRDSDLFDDGRLLADPLLLTDAQITSTLAIYSNLPDRTKTYLAVQNHSASFFVLANPDLFSNSSLRSLSDINATLGALTDAEFTTLLELDLGRVVLEIGDNNDGVIPFPFIDGSPANEIKATITHYNQLDTNQKYVLRELGIIGNENVAIVGADTDGLNRLLTAYGDLPDTLRAATERLHEGSSSGSTYGSASGDIKDHSFFFPRGYNENTTILGVSFQSTGDLHVGATRYLRIDGLSNRGDTFVAGANKDVYLHAADLIDLNSTAFSAGIRSITMSAATINLSNLTIPEGAVASLNSKYGQTNFGSTGVYGKVNFFNVTYGNSTVLDADNFSMETRGNIAIGTLTNPAALPTYTAPVFNVK